MPQYQSTPWLFRCLMAWGDEAVAQFGSEGLWNQMAGAGGADASGFVDAQHTQ